MTIYDVTDKVGNVTNIISITTFPGAEYIHQGSVNDVMNQEYLFLDDEFDERDAEVGPMTQGLPSTHIFDIRDLEKPKYTGVYHGKTRSIDHNQYVYGNLLYQSNYGNGLNVLDISSVKEDPTGSSICEAGFFDIYPEDDENEGGGTVGFLGSWSSYAGFKSGFILVHTIERGSFIVKMTSKDCPAPPVCPANECSASLESSLEASTEFCHKFLVRQNDDERLIPEYAGNACAGDDAIAQVSSACACVPTVPVPELPRTTSRPPVPTVLPPKV